MVLEHKYRWVIYISVYFLSGGGGGGGGGGGELVCSWRKIYVVERREIKEE